MEIGGIRPNLNIIRLYILLPIFFIISVTALYSAHQEQLEKKQYAKILKEIDLRLNNFTDEYMLIKEDLESLSDVKSLNILENEREKLSAALDTCADENLLQTSKCRSRIIEDYTDRLRAIRLDFAKGPSFSCDAVNKPEDITVCNNVLLSNLDRNLAKSYFALIDAYDASDWADYFGLKNSQQDWISSKQDCATDIPCLFKSYENRIKELAELKRLFAQGPTLKDAKLADENGEYSRAATILQKLSDQNNKTATFELALRYLGPGSLGTLLEKEHAGYEAGRGVFVSTEKAINLLKKAVDLGHGDSAWFLARIYQLGEGVNTDIDLAISYFTQAVKLGASNASEEVWLAELIMTERPGPRYTKTVLSLLSSAAEFGDPNGQFHLGMFYLKGVDAEPNLDKAFDWLQKSALNEKYEAINALIDLFFDYPNEDFDISELKIKASENFVPAQYLLSSYYMSKGDEKNIIKYLSMAARNDIKTSQFLLGTAYLEGNWGLGIDHKQAFQWIKKAADNNNSEAIALVGSMYQDGIGVEKNLVAARNYLKIASDNGNPLSSYYLGRMLLLGLGGPENAMEAIELLFQAASNEIPEAFSLLGYFYLTSDKVQQDLPAFYAWTSLAIDYGDKNSVKLLNAIKPLLNEDDILTGEKIKQKCIIQKFLECTQPRWKSNNHRIIS